MAIGASEYRTAGRRQGVGFSYCNNKPPILYKFSKTYSITVGRASAVYSSTDSFAHALSTQLLYSSTVSYKTEAGTVQIGSSPVLPPPSSQRNLGFYHGWVLCSVPSATRRRKKKAKLMTQPQNDLSPMPKNIIQFLCQHQSDEPSSSASHTKVARTQYGRRWSIPMMMLTASGSSSLVCIPFIGSLLETTSYPRYLPVLARRYCRS